MAKSAEKYRCRKDPTKLLRSPQTCELQKHRARMHPNNPDLDRCRVCTGPVPIDQSNPTQEGGQAAAPKAMRERCTGPEGRPVSAGPASPPKGDAPPEPAREIASGSHSAKSVTPQGAGPARAADSDGSLPVTPPPTSGAGPDAPNGGADGPAPELSSPGPVSRIYFSYLRSLAEAIEQGNKKAAADFARALCDLHFIRNGAPNA